VAEVGKGRAPCPNCGEATYESDAVCMSCEANLIALRAYARQEAEAAARLRAVDDYVTEQRAAVVAVVDIYGALVRAGWADSSVREILGLDTDALIVELPDGCFDLATTGE